MSDEPVAHCSWAAWATAPHQSCVVKLLHRLYCNTKPVASCDGLFWDWTKGQAGGLYEGVKN
jgi:hypothetical protein